MRDLYIKKESLIKRQGNSEGEQTQRELYGIDSARSQCKEAWVGRRHSLAALREGQVVQASKFAVERH